MEYSNFRGVTTGCNEAFIIDQAKRDELVAADPKSVKIIKPVLRGRDIQRYQAKWAGLWLICTFPALSLDINQYPAVKQYLTAFGKNRLEQSGKNLANGLKARKKTNNKWFEMQDAIAYHPEFTKEKLIWMDMSDRGRFAYSETEMYCNDKGFILGGKSLKYLCAILNSTIITWLIKNMALTTGVGLTQWKKFIVEEVPVPQITATNQQPFIRIVDRILQAKSVDSTVNAEKLEAEIDQLVYQLYDLTDEEIRLLRESNAERV